MNNLNIPSLSYPGIITQLPTSIANEIKQINHKFKNRLTFFGGHPISITKQSLNSLNELTYDHQHQVHSPYLVCEKTDGVRYLLLISRQKDYMISRQGSKSIVAYEVNCKVGRKWAKSRPDHDFKEIVEILDGQLTQDYDLNGSKTQLKYLIFDALIHQGKSITSCSLKRRLNCVQKFIHCNQFQLSLSPKQPNDQRIQLKLKDFFRMSIPKFNTVDFILNKYIKCLPHQNDGIIFNHESKEYIFGENDGYIKWKPSHLNTLDFFIVPNQNLIDRFGKRVIDLYLGSTSQDTGLYTRVFYNFSVVEEQRFDEIMNLTQKKYEQNEKKQKQGTDYFVGVIAQCRYDDSTAQERQIFKELLNFHLDPKEIQEYIMKKNYGEDQLQAIIQLQKLVYIKCWKLYKIRNDKPLPNNISIAKRIQQSIKDNITPQQLIKLTRELGKQQFQGIKR